MLSIIISSYQQQYYDQLIKNINETIGDKFPYEIIQVWNPAIMSITQAYNIGAEKSHYELLLFLHEDVIFHTKNWGEKLIEHFNYSNVGVIGIAGSSYVPVAPCSWTVAKKYNFVNILQGSKENMKFTEIRSTTKKRTQVLALDGVFLAVKKTIFDDFIFDENLDGFHGYDLDFSLRIAKKFQNYVVDDILIQHFSGGNLNKIWFDTNMKIREKLGSNFNTKFDSKVEKDVFISFLYNYFRYYPVNIKNVIFSLKFYPKKITFINHLAVAKIYFNYIRYAKSINKKLNAKI